MRIRHFTQSRSQPRTPPHKPPSAIRPNTPAPGQTRTKQIHRYANNFRGDTDHPAQPQPQPTRPQNKRQQTQRLITKPKPTQQQTRKLTPPLASQPGEVRAKRSTRMCERSEAPAGGPGAAAPPAGGVGAWPPQNETRRQACAFRRHAAPRVEWARGELNPHVLSDTRT